MALLYVTPNGAMTDDTASVQWVIEQVRQAGGGQVCLAHGINGSTFYIGHRTGAVEIAAHDDGTSASAGAIAPEPVACQAYSLMLPDNVKLIGQEGVSIQGPYVYGNASPDELITICLGATRDAVFDVAVENIVFNDCFIAVGGLTAATIAASSFVNLRFNACAFGLLVKGLERSFVDRIYGQGTACPISVGGFWGQRDDFCSEAGGFSDKSFFGFIANIFGRNFGAAEAAIDAWFDAYLFKTANNATRLVRGDGSATRYPFYGVTGRALYVGARYSRASHSNRFGQISHHYSHRGGVRVECGRGSNIDGVYYVEGCGYQNGVTRTNPVGVGYTDPYLGAGVLTPDFVHGVTGNVAVQNSYGAQAASSTIFPTFESGNTLTVSQNAATNLNNLAVTGGLTLASGALTALAAVAHELGALGVRSLGFNNSRAFDTGLSLNAGGNGRAVLALVSRNTGAGTNTSSALYLLNFHYDGATAPDVTLVAGTNIATWGVSAGATLTVQGASGGNYAAIFLTDKAA